MESKRGERSLNINNPRIINFGTYEAFQHLINSISGEMYHKSARGVRAPNTVRKFSNLNYLF